MAAGVGAALLSQTFLPYGRQEITDEDVDAVVEALRGGADHAGPDASTLRAGAGGLPRRARTSSRSRTAPPRFTARRSLPGSAPATRCSRRR